MTDLSGSRFSSAYLRWSMLIVVAASLGFIADYSKLSASPTVAEVLSRYGDALLPAGFAASLGAIIVVAFLCFFVSALRPRRRRVRVHDKLVIPLAAASVLAACLLVAFRHQQIGLSVALIAASLVASGVMFVRVAAVTPGKHSRWMLIPFSLYAGAMTLALMVAVLLWQGGGALGEAVGGRDNLAAALLVAAAVAGGFVALRYRDFVYPAVIATAMGSIVLRAHEPLARPALVVCAGMLVVAVLAAVALARGPGRDLAAAVHRRRATTLRKAGAGEWHATEAGTSVMRV